MSRRYLPRGFSSTFLSLLLAAFIPTPLPAGELCPEFVGTDAIDVAAGDFDEDGFADLAVVATPAKIALVFGQAGPRPTRYGTAIPTGALMDRIAAGDVNGDGHADLVATSSLAGYLRVLLGSGTGSFSMGGPTAAGDAPRQIVLADFDGDGSDDAAVLSHTAQQMTVLLADGSGALIAASTHAITGAQQDLAAGDLDGDGDRDLVILSSNPATQTGYVSVYRGNGDGSFAAPLVGQTAYGLNALDMGDLDENGRDDVVATGSSVAVFPGQADGSLGARTDVAGGEGLGGRASLADLDGDGHLDLAALGGPYPQDILGCLGNVLASFLGAGDGTLTRVEPAVATAGRSIGLATGDLNGDGRADAAVAGGACGNVAVHLADAAGALPALAHPVRAFVDKRNEVIRLNANKDWCVSFEPTNGSFDLASETLSIELVSAGTGNVTTIVRDASKPFVLGDQDGNLVPDIRVCFRKADLRQLFSNVSGRQTLTVRVEGVVGTLGCRFSGPITVDVLAGGNNAAAFARPDADGHGWTLSYRAERAGTVRVRLFDVAGRLVRSVPAGPALEGWNDVRIEGRAASARPLGSGVYFYKIEGAGAPVTGRLVIAR